MEFKNSVCFCTSIWVKDEEQVVGEDLVTLFTSAIGDDTKDMPEVITSLPPLNVVVGCVLCVF